MTGTIAAALEPLVQFLESLTGRAALDDLVRELRGVKIDCDDLAGHIRFSTQSYARNLVRAGTWYHLLVLCWRNGQRSPIHDHAGSSCGLRVMRGTLTETTFGCAPNGHIKALGSRDFAPGCVIATQDSDLHQVSNLQSGSADLVTLHVYSPPLLRMGTYSLTDTKRGEDPMFLEFSDAAGI